jgi:hypothetical protein
MPFLDMLEMHSLHRYMFVMHSRDVGTEHPQNSPWMASSPALAQASSASTEPLQKQPCCAADTATEVQSAIMSYFA